MVEVTKLTRELEKAGLPVVSVFGDGRIDYSRELAKEEQALASEIISKHDPNPSYAENRSEEYLRVGATDHEMMIALWEYVIENRPDAANAIQEKRLAVKTKYPKQMKG